MTDRDLWLAAWKELTLTTDSYPTWKRKGFPATSHWAKAKAIGDQIGAVAPPSPTHPASYTAGPLGVNNLIPTRPWLVEYYGGIGQTWADVKTMVPAREAAIGRSFDGIHVGYWNGGTTSSGLYGFAQAERNEQRLEWVHARGKQPVVSWSPPYSIADVNAGKADQILGWVADWWKTYDFPIMLRLWWEFDNDPANTSFQWAVGHTPNIGAPFVQAWKRVINLFQARAATNVGFWWCPLEGGDRAGVNQSYPGDTYVDWVGSDVYNDAYVGENHYASPLHPGFASLADCCLYGPTSQYALWSPRKPFVIGELGCVYDPNAPTAKANWFRQIPAALQTAPNLLGLSFFDQDISSVEHPGTTRSNWLVDFSTATPDVMAGYKQMANSL